MALSTAGSTSASHDSVVMIPNKFTPTRCFYFQSACLDQRMKNTRSGQSGMRNMAGYIIMFCTDAAFCYICSYV